MMKHKPSLPGCIRDQQSQLRRQKVAAVWQFARLHWYSALNVIQCPCSQPLNRSSTKNDRYELRLQCSSWLTETFVVLHDIGTYVYIIWIYIYIYTYICNATASVQVMRIPFRASGKCVPQA